MIGNIVFCLFFFWYGKECIVVGIFNELFLMKKCGVVWYLCGLLYIVSYDNDGILFFEVSY